MRFIASRLSHYWICAATTVPIETVTASANAPRPSMPSISEPVTIGQRWTSAIDTVRILICQVLKIITHWSATHPWTTVITVTVFSLAMITVGIFTNFRVETNGDVLWPPQDSTTQIYKRWIDEAGFSQELDFISLYIHRNGDNLLSPGRAKESLDKLFEVYGAITNLQNEGNDFGFQYFCDQPYTHPDTNITSSCDDFGVIEFWNSNYSMYLAQVTSDEEAIQQISAPQFPTGKTVDTSRIFGGVAIDDNTNLFTRVEVYRFSLGFPIREGTWDFFARATDLVLELSDDAYNVEILTSRSFDDEFQAAIVKDIPLMPMAFIVMSIFCCIVFGRWDRVRSQALVGFGAVVTVLFSILTGYGLMFICGIPLTSATQVVVFVMFGIGELV